MTSDRIRRRIEQLLDEADAAVAHSEWAVVRDRAQNVLRLDPGNADALAYLAATERDQASSDSTPMAAPAHAPDRSSKPALPTSFASGRYRVVRFLGQGGKKRVYLAHDSRLDRDVAFALIKSEGLDQEARARISREAQAMGRLGDHPNIVTIHDIGDKPSTGSGQGGQPYIVAQFMPMGDVEGLIEQAPDHKLPLEQALKLVQEMCLGLEHAHSHGIIHRDLKPGNVWLTAEGIAKIGDFGLAVAVDRSRLTQAGMMVGTVSYMPPEQAMGGEVTPRSDLYALGAMLYELVCGRPPFLGDDPVAIIGQHINTPPVAPTWHNAGCPRALEALIMRLLAKDPAERPQDAGDVRAALGAIDLHAVAEASPGQEAQVLDSLAGGVFVGRQREMGELKAALEDALSGRGRLATLVGEPGIGKTRTAQELATYAGLRQTQVLWGRCYEGVGAPPYWPWVQAIRTYVRERDPVRVRSEMGAGAADIAEIVSDIGERLPDLKPPPTLEPEQARFRLFDSITAFLKSAGRRQPLVLILEDLHWADGPSLLLLEFVTRELSGARLLIIGTYRDVEVSRKHPLSQTLAELTRERLFQRILLRGLAQEDVRRFIELVSGEVPPRGAVEAVYRQTEGNPLFVTEVVRLLVQEGHMAAGAERVEGRSGRGGYLECAHPRGDTGGDRQAPGPPLRTVLSDPHHRLGHRPRVRPGAARTSRRRSVGARRAHVRGPAAGGAGGSAGGARVLEELPRALWRYQFTHALIQETLAEELTITRRLRLHARIGEVLEAIYGMDAEAHAAELAHHFTEAQTVLGTAKLVRYSLLAGERALETYAYEEALAAPRLPRYRYTDSRRRWGRSDAHSNIT